MTKSAADTLLEVLQEHGLPINTNTINNVHKVVDADLALVVASWIDLARSETKAGRRDMDTSNDALQAILRQFQQPLQQTMLDLQGELGALAGALEDEGSDKESYVLGIYNEAYDLRLKVEAFFETWLDK